MRRVTLGLMKIAGMILLLAFVGQLFAKPSFKWGFVERLRHEYMNNNADFKATTTDASGKTIFDDEQGMFRIRTSISAEIGLNKNWSAKAMLTNEFRPATNIRTADEGKEFTFDEIFFDQLYLKYTTGGENPLAITLGRQNLIYGEGFILLEGAPWDGSRAIYHDALKISLKRGATTIDLLGISDTRFDYRLPTLKFWDKDKIYRNLSKDPDGNKWMNDGLEEALGLYVKNSPNAAKAYEGYYFYKAELPQPWINKGATLDQLSRLYIHTIGGRVTQPLTEKLSAVTEWAYQTGGQAENKQNSYGGYLNFNYKIAPKKNGIGTVGMYVLSGDDPATPDIEGWNPLFAQWPKWSELYIYSTIGPENNGGAGKVGYSTNTISPNIKFVMDLTSKLNLTLWYHNLTSFYAPNSSLGTTRGNEFQMWLRVKFNKQLSGHFLYDYFIPGDFYSEPRANASFIRFELMYTL